MVDPQWTETCTSTGTGTWSLTDTTAQKTSGDGWTYAANSLNVIASSGGITVLWNYTTSTGNPEDSLMSVSKAAPTGLCTQSVDESFGDFTVYNVSTTHFKVYDNQNSNVSASIPYTYGTSLFKMTLSESGGMKCYHNDVLITMGDANPVSSGDYKFYFNPRDAGGTIITLTYSAGAPSAGGGTRLPPPPIVLGGL